MGRFAKNIAPYVLAELGKAESASENGDHGTAFRHLENAHVLGQESTYESPPVCQRPPSQRKWLEVVMSNKPGNDDAFRSMADR